MQGVAFDRWHIDLLKKEFDEIGLQLPLVPHGQGFKDMSPALDALESEALNGRIRHGHPVLTMCAAGAVVYARPARQSKTRPKAKQRAESMALLRPVWLSVKPPKHKPRACPKCDIFWM